MLHILFVCTGNTCRSPMAAALFGRISQKYNINSIFSSAGLGFCHGQPVSPNAVTVCNEIGMDISEHKARIIREHDIEIADIFVVMTESHANDLINIGVPKDKIYILGGGISDPYGFDIATYRLCRNTISDAVEEFCKVLQKKIKNGDFKENGNGKNNDN